MSWRGVLLLNFLNWVTSFGIESKISDKAAQKCKDWTRCCSRKYNTNTAFKSSQLYPLLACNDQAKTLLFAVTTNWHSWCLDSYQNTFLSLPRIVPILLHFVNAFTQKSQEMFGCLWGDKQLILNSKIVRIETSVRKLAQTYYLEWREKTFIRERLFGDFQVLTYSCT